MMSRESLKTCEVYGASYNSEDQIMQFLMGLDDHFSGMRSQILLMDPLPSLNKVFALILQDERQKEIVAKKQQQFDVVACSGKLIPNSIGNQRSSAHSQSQKVVRPICSQCGMLGHLKGKSYKLVG